MKMQIKRILITSAGGLAGTYLIKHLKQKGGYYLVGVDMSDFIPFRAELDASYLVPPNSDEGYLEEIAKIIGIEKIDILIPVSSWDIDIYSREEVKEKLKPVRMLLLSYDIHKILSNKELSNYFLKKLEIKVPKIYEQDNNIEFPCVLKAKEGSGSKNVVQLESMEDYLYWKKKIRDYVIFEYLSGKEYTVDCLFDDTGKCVGYNIRERIKMNGGGTIISRCVREKKLEDIIEKLESSKAIKGPVNFQYKVVNNQICIFDFNTRFASGGLPLSVQAGFDIPVRLINLIEGEKMERWNLDEKDVGLTMMRYYEEKYENIF